MAKAKVKISRALGIALTSKSARIMEKRGSTPGQHGMNRKRTPSVYKAQLMEKQRLRATYNISEKQLKKYFKEAQRSEENTGEMFLRLLESRADSAIYRMGFAKTMYAARQYVSHGHFLINGRRTKTPSQLLKPGTVISVLEKSKSHPQMVESLTNSGSILVPGYFEINKVKMEGKMIKAPTRDQIPVSLNEQLVVEFYSR